MIIVMMMMVMIDKVIFILTWGMLDIHLILA